MFRFPGQVAITLIIACVSAGTVCAQAYPSKTVRIVVPFAAGGGTDVIARYLAAGLTESLKNQVIVDNRAGANAIVGTELVARAPADGYTLLFVSSPHSVNPSMYAKLPYDTLRDFAPVSLIALSPYFLVVHPSLPARNVKELIALARSKPGALYMGITNGSINHLGGAYLASMANVKVTLIAYKSTAVTITDAMTGQIHMFLQNFQSSLPHVKSGRLRALAVTTAERSSVLPELPTVAESGVPGYEYSTWYGLLAPARTPRAITDNLNQTTVAVLNAPDYRERLLVQGLDPVPSSAAHFSSYLRSETAKWTKVVRAAKIPLQ